MRPSRSPTVLRIASIIILLAISRTWARYSTRGMIPGSDIPDVGAPGHADFRQNTRLRREASRLEVPELWPILRRRRVPGPAHCLGGRRLGARIRRTNWRIALAVVRTAPIRLARIREQNQCHPRKTGWMGAGPTTRRTGIQASREAAPAAWMGRDVGWIACATFQRDCVPARGCVEDGRAPGRRARRDSWKVPVV